MDSVLDTAPGWQRTKSAGPAILTITDYQIDFPVPVEITGPHQSYEDRRVSRTWIGIRDVPGYLTVVQKQPLFNGE